VCPNDFSLETISGRERFGVLDTAQPAEPGIIHAHEMDDLVAHRPMRIADLARELLLGERGDIFVPDLSVFGEMVAIEMAKDVCDQGKTSPVPK